MVVQVGAVSDRLWCLEDRAVWDYVVYHHHHRQHQKKKKHDDDDNSSLVDLFTAMPTLFT